MLTVCTVLGKICNSCKFMTNEERSLNKYTKNSNCRILEVGSISSQAMIVQFVLSLAVLSAVEQATGTDVLDIHMKSQEKLASQAKGRISLQNTAEIQHCLLAAGDVGCAVFECFENNSCEINGLQQICMTFLHNAGKFNSQGKSFIKDALKCMAHGLRHKFSCISRKCLAVKDMVLQLQRECYVKHNLCSAAKENVNVMVQMIHFQDLFSKGPYVELVNILLGCGELVKEAITRSVRLQCEQNWGALCESLSFCSLGQPEPQTPPTPAPEHLRHARDSQRQPHPSGTHSKRSVAPWQGDRAKTLDCLWPTARPVLTGDRQKDRKQQEARTPPSSTPSLYN